MKARPKIENYKYSDGSGYDDLRHHADIEQWAGEAEQQNKQLRAALELALEALEEAQLMGDFSDDIEAIKDVLNKER